MPILKIAGMGDWPSEGRDANHSASLNLNTKFLDLVQFSGTKRAVLRTFRWEADL